MSLWADYVKEREGLDVLEKDYGFVCYKFFLPDECFVQAIYIRPQDRKNGIGTQLAKELEEMAREKGCKIMTCKIDHLEMNATLSLQAILSYGFKVIAADKQVIYLAKEMKK